MASSQVERNKAIAKEFFQKVFGDHDYDALYNYLAEDFVHHNPDIVGGRDALRKALDGPLSGLAKGPIDFKKISGDGDLVWLHTRLIVDGAVYSVVDMLRFNEQGKIVENWDVMQPITGEEPNPVAFF